METIDKLTLELLMNKNTYNRYIEKTDPNKHKEEQEIRRKITKYKSRIIQMTLKYLDDANFQVNNELNNMFSEYSKTFVKYFEKNDLEISCFYNDTNDKEDMMFEPTNMEDPLDTINEIEDDTAEILSTTATVGKECNKNPRFSKNSTLYTMDKYVLRK